MGNGTHIETVVGFGTLPVPTLIDGHHIVAKVDEVLGNAIPQPSIRGKTVHQEHGGPGKSGFAPRDAMEMQDGADFVHLVLCHCG